MKRIITLLIVLLTNSIVTNAQFSYQDALKKANDMVGLAAPDFEATTIGGKKVSSSSLKGKIVVVNFWFVGCPPCEEEMPLLNKLTETYKQRDDIVFLSFAKTDEQLIKKFLVNTPFNYQTVAAAKSIAEKFNVSAYPTQFIIDKEGNVQFTSIGGMDDIDKLLENKINKLLVMADGQ